MKIKLYFQYEGIEDAIRLTVKALNNFPQEAEDCFPKHYLFVLL